MLVPTTQPNRPSDLDSTSPKHRGLTKQQIAENFKELERVWDDIGMQDVVFPSPQGPLCLVLEQSGIKTQDICLPHQFNNESVHFNEFIPLLNPL
jgi:hypothetical protein